MTCILHNQHMYHKSGLGVTAAYCASSMGWGVRHTPPGDASNVSLNSLRFISSVGQFFMNTSSGKSACQNGATQRAFRICS